MSANQLKLSRVTIPKKRLAAATLSTLYIEECQRFAAFLTEEATQFAPNPFAVTSVRVVWKAWATRRIEFPAFGIIEAGLAALLSCARARRPTYPLVQEVLKARPLTWCLFHDGDGCGIHGRVLHGKPGVEFPAFTPRRHPRRRLCRGNLSPQMDQSLRS